jgi:transposase
MLSFKGKEIYLACGATDMRNNIDGLSAAVQSRFKLAATSNAVFVFCNAMKDRIKILEWDGDGFWLHYKRLERGRFPWPEKSGDEKKMTLSHRELEYLLSGEKLRLKFDRIDYSGRALV